MSTVRQSIVDAIVAKLATVPEIGGRVSAWRIEQVKLAECPCLVVFDTVSEGSFEYASLGEQAHALQIEVVLFTAPTAQAVVTREIMGKAIQAIGSDPHFGLANNVTLAELKSVSLSRDKYNDVASGGHLSFVVNYVTTIWNI
jgi:hypothetical protein